MQVRDRTGGIERPSADPATVKEIRSLTGVRGVAALVVAIYHLIYLTAPIPYPGYVFPGYLAVDLFFSLSGFVLALTYAERFRASPTRERYVDFIKKRFSRIYPVYFVLMAVKVPLTMALGTGHYEVATVLANILLVQFWGFGSLDSALGLTIFGPSWSISTEMFVYLIFPGLVATAVYGRRRLALGIGFVCVATLLLVSVKAHGVRGVLDANDGGTLFPLMRCIAGFTLGLLAWRVADRTRFLRQQGWWLDGVLLAILATLLVVSGTDVLIALSFPILIIRLSVDGSLLSRLLSRRLPFFLGQVSYSLYLIQSTTIAVLQGRLIAALSAHHVGSPRLLASLALLALDIGIATILFVRVEKPARRYLRTLFDGRSPPPIVLDPAAP